MRECGGIKPAARKRSASHLTLEEREEIRAGLSSKMSIRAIARQLDRAPSTISREINKNKGDVGIRQLEQTDEPGDKVADQRAICWLKTQSLGN